MSDIGHIHVGDVHEFLITVKTKRVGGVIVPLTGPVVFRFKRPCGTTFDASADLATDGSDGQATYTTVAGQLNEAGDDWEIQVCDNGTWHTDQESFPVLPNLPEPA